MMDKFELFGEKLYGEKWPVIKRAQVARVTNDRTEDAEQLTPKQLQRLVAGQINLLRKITNSSMKG